MSWTSLNKRKPFPFFLATWHLKPNNYAECSALGLPLGSQSVYYKESLGCIVYMEICKHSMRLYMCSLRRALAGLLALAGWPSDHFPICNVQISRCLVQPGEINLGFFPFDRNGMRDDEFGTLWYHLSIYENDKVQIMQSQNDV